MSEGSDEEIVVVAGQKSGYIERIPTGKKKGKFLWCTLSGSSMYAFQDPQQSTARSVYELKNVKVTTAAGKRFTLDLEKDGKALFSLAATSKEEFESWLEALNDCVKKEPGPPPEKEKIKRKKGSMGARIGKNVGGVVVTSGLGKTAVKGVVNEETKLLLIALKKIIAKVETPKIATEMEENLMKIITKSFFLEKDKKITMANFLLADAPLREAFELLISMRDFSHRMKPETVNQKLGQVHDFLLQVEKIITDMLLPHLKAKSIKRIGRTFGLLGSEDFLKKAWSDPDLEEERDLLTDAMNRYTQFHFN